MLWIRVGANLINIHLIERITRIANNNWTVKMASSETFTGLTNTDVDVVLTAIGYSY